MLATRVSIVAELLIAGAATVLVAVSPPRPAPVHREALRVVHVELMSAPPPKVDCTAPLPPKLQSMYEWRQFGALEHALDGCRDAQQLLHQLEHAWATAIDVQVSFEARGQAVHDAIKLDIAFGGYHTDALVRLLGDIARGYERDQIAHGNREARLEAQFSGVLSPAAKNAAQ